MNNITLKDEQLKAVAYGEELVIDNEKWVFIEEDGEPTEDEHARYEYFIYQRPSDKKYFRVVVTYTRYGYKDYGFNEYMQDYIAFEVEKREIIRLEWVNAKKRE